ncbi:MAG TPA: GLUG motif-containing protein, partial [Candidatus Hydrogenedens sp.]|nr:GLUG motif-containing protein [Candidatus Hydrogenedens sp.]
MIERKQNLKKIICLPILTILPPPWLLFLFLFLSLNSYAVIQISTIDELQKIGNDPSYPMNGSYVLTNDIDASVTKDWNDGAGFIPLGSNTNPFMGQFNGNGHVISNLYINGRVSNLLDSGYVGLFRRVESGAVVEKLGLENCFMISAQYIAGIAVNNNGTISQCFVTGYIAGNLYMGGVVGTNYGTISQCYSTAYIIGESYIGGIVGYNIGLVVQCYSNSNVTGISNIGGLVGINSNTISQCYSIGAVLGTLYTGGLVGYNFNTVIQSYWNIETSGQTGSSGGEGKTTAEMKQKATYTGWDFDYYWEIVENVTYPYIQDLGPIPSINAPVEREIWSLKDLDRIGKDWDYPWNGKYYLMTNIDAKETNQWNNGEGFSPIYPFCGEFYGNGYAITNLYINRQNKSYIGLFEKVILGKVYDLQMLDVWFVGNNYVGGFAGYNSGTIEKSHSTGFIMGYEYVGGIVGFNISLINVTSFEGSLIGNNSCGGIVGYNYGSIFLSYSVGRITGNYTIGGLVGNNYDGTINQCYSTGEVSGASYVGGLAGYNLGTIEKCYSMSKTSGSDGIGGLVGRNFDTISECYSAGAVSGTSNTGGLIGAIFGGAVSNSYWDMETSGQTSSAGGEGKTTTEMKTQANYAGWDFISIWGIIEDITYPYLLGLGMTQSYTEPVEIEIWTLDDLLKIGTTPDYPYDGHYVLMADIDASETIGWDDGKGFKPISLFAGVFEGDAHTISNLYINQYNQSYLALFSKLVGGKIKNLNLQNVWVCGDTNISGLVTQNYGVISNCHVTGIISGNTLTGGISACNFNHIEKSWFKGYVNGRSNVGAITGTNEYGANIDTCYSVTLVSGVENIGGLTGANSGTIIQCYSTEEVSGNKSVGGLVGYNSGTIEQCYSKGRVIGGVDTGGLVGVNYSSVTDSYWDTNTSGQYNSAGGEGRTTTQMKTQSNYVGWNFPGIWRIIEGVSYPYLTELGPTQQPLPIPISIDIWSIEDLNKIGRDWNYPWNATYNLRADIDASDTINWDGGKGFNPIDTFTGVFNGNGYSIQDLYINRPDEDIVSLFRTL